MYTAGTSGLVFNRIILIQDLTISILCTFLKKTL